MPQQSGQPDFSPEHFFRRPDLYLLEFTARGGNIVPMNRDSYMQSIFTDKGRIVPASPTGWEIGMADLLRGYEGQGLKQPALGFVFHIAHCGSTLLARALDVADRTLVYREPYTLRQLAADAAGRPEGPKDLSSWQRQLRLSTGLLGRTFSDGQAAIVKANVPVNFIIPQLMGLADGSRGILLYAGLERYLLSVLKSPMHQRWVMNVLGHIAGAVMTTDPLGSAQLAGITPPQAAACLWLAQMYRYSDALAADARLKSLDCEDLFSRPADTVAAAFGHLGVRMSAGEVADIVASDLFARHAKNPDRAYDSADREAELQQLKRQLAAELAAGMAWADEVMAQRKLSLPLMNPLLV
jgi:hypothetical protein